MYKVSGLLSFPGRRKLRQLDFRVPEDSLSVDEGDEKEVRSPGIDRMIKAYYDADHAGDDSEKAAALRGMIDEMTALHKLRGSSRLRASAVTAAVRRRAGRWSEACGRGRRCFEDRAFDRAEQSAGREDAA